MEKYIRFIENQEGKKGIVICLSDTAYLSENPVEIEVKAAEAGFCLYRSGYERVEKTETGYQCQAVVETAYGSQFAVSDVYQWTEGEVIFTRRVEVIQEDGREAGFSSAFSLQEEGGYGLKELFIHSYLPNFH